MGTTNGQCSYRIVIAEELDSSWEEWFAPLELKRSGGTSVLTGMLQDRTAVYGILKKIQTLGLTVRSLNPMDVSKEEI